MVKRAVVVGINDYSVQTPDGSDNLSGCVPDARSMYHLLINAFGFDASQVFYYADSQASRSNILRALRYILVNSELGDVACFYYAGHGARIRAEKGKVDCDQYYEAIIPASGDWITDWEIFQMANELEQSVVNFTVILDACHSGGIHESDRIQKCRSLVFNHALVQAMVAHMHTLIPFGIAIPIGANLLANNVSNVVAASNQFNGAVDLDEDPDKTLVQLSKSTLISGCRYDELSWETFKDGQPHGMLTQSFLDLVNQSNFQITHDDLLSKLRQSVAEKIKRDINPIPEYATVTQTPQLRGQMNRMEELFLAGWRDSR